MQEKLKLKDARLTAMLPAIFEIAEEIAKELLFLDRIVPRWVYPDFDYQWLSIRCILETMVGAFGQVNGRVARFLHYSSLGRIGSCWLVPDSCAAVHEKIFCLEKVEMLGWVEEGFVVWDVMGDEIGCVRTMESL